MHTKLHTLFFLDDSFLLNIKPNINQSFSVCRLEQPIGIGEVRRSPVSTDILTVTWKLSCWLITNFHATTTAHYKFLCIYYALYKFIVELNRIELTNDFKQRKLQQNLHFRSLWVFSCFSQLFSASVKALGNLVFSGNGNWLWTVVTEIRG